jgi:hypothetical protein
MTALITLTVVAIACLVLVELQNRRFQRERETWASERADLLQRIQAPEQAVLEHQTVRGITSPPAVNPFDDEDYWQAANMTKEQLAEQMTTLELARTDGFSS